MEVLKAYKNIDPTIRPCLTEAAAKSQTMDGLSLPELRLLPISAEIYTHIDTLTGKYNDIPA